MSTVSSAVQAGPVNVKGNSWTYALFNQSGGALGTETLTSQGLNTSYAVQPAIEIDIVYTDPSGAVVATGQNFYGNQPDGYVLYESKLLPNQGGSQDEVYASPYHLIAPASLTTNVAFNTPAATLTQTSTSPAGTVTTTTSNTFNTITLVSDTPNVTTVVPKGTFNCYQFNSTTTDTGSAGNSDPNVTQTFVDPTIGLVEVITSTGTSKLTNFTGTSFQLATTTPGKSLAEGKIPAVQVSLVDSAGNPDTSAADQVTITPSLSTASTGTGALTGNTPITTSGGVATFNDLSIDKPGQYVLTFTDSTGRVVSTGSFDVSAGMLRFKRRVSNAVAGSTFEPTTEVELVNSKGKLITDAPSLVTLSISGANSANTITGNTAELVGGIALFPGLKLGVPGAYTLDANDAQGDTHMLSNQFEVTGVHLAFRRNLSEAGVNAPLRYTVALEDSRNRLINRSNIGIGLTLNTIDGGSNAVITNSGDVFVAGIADNAGPGQASINSPGTYTITFTIVSESVNAFDYTIDPITSKEFVIAANHLQFVKQPHTTEIGLPLSYEVVLKDYRGHTVTSGADTLQFTLTPKSGETTAVLASNTDTLVNGIASNLGRGVSVNLPGSFQLSVVDVPADPAQAVADPVKSAFFNIRGPKV